MLYLESPSHDPYFNLAAEQYVFDTLSAGKDCLMLWQNDKAVIIGKYQNAAAEINAAFVKEHGIRVVRRLSGGGAVYHDLGNINYTFITDSEGIERLSLQRFCVPLRDALRDLGVPAVISGRNDITIGGLKCSGSSQYIKNGRVLHHGTVMFDSDLSTVAGALNVSEDKYRFKGTKSVRSRVANIRPHLPQDMDIAGFFAVLKEKMLGAGEAEEYSFTENDIVCISRLRDSVYSTWEWNYGRSGAFSVNKSRRIEGCGTIEVSMDTDHGIIRKIEFHGDYFAVKDSGPLCRMLYGCELKEEALRPLLESVDIEDYFHALTAGELVKVILE
ncbi:MAG: lipoate--protein ligase [Lachnospiraceae bacterium]|nr:lipoate--protein ligase [Lachnospiraceae bacterium]